MFGLTRPISLDADDRELLLRMHAGHEASARALWERHAARLIAIAAGISRDRAGAGGGDAHDIVQMVLCKVLELPRDRIRAIDDVPAYFARAVRNAALNHARSAHRQDAHARAACERPRGGVEALSDGERLESALDQLHPDDRELVLLKHAGGLTFDQLAAALDLNRSTLSTRYRAALDQLRRHLNVPSSPASPANVGGGM